MPTLTSLDRKVVLSKGDKSLPQAEVGRTGSFVLDIIPRRSRTQAIVEVTLYTGTYLPSFDFITLYLYPKAGSEGGEAEIREGVDIIPVCSKLLVIRNISKEILSKTYHLTGVECIEITDESVNLDAGLALLCKCGKGENSESNDCKYLFHFVRFRQKGKVW